MIGALLMLKNEENSIQETIDSIRDYIKHVIVFDTGSTDNTLSVLKKICKRNKQVLHIKTGTFRDFARSRNEAIEFAESIAREESLSFLLLMDAGDIFQCVIPRLQLLQVVQTISNDLLFGIVKKKWQDKTGLIEHYDVRFIRVGRKCRYNTNYPVHETFANRTVQNMIFLKDLFVLYQDRLAHGNSSNNRFLKDVELLSNAPITKRNYYYLGQTYMNMDDYENGLKYNILALETPEKDTTVLDSMDDYTVLLRIINCAYFLKKDHDTIAQYVQKALQIKENNIDVYIYYMKYCIDNKLYENAVPYIKKLASLEKLPEKESTITNHNYYDYLRWHLISVICLFTNDYVLGKEACEKALRAHDNPMDRQNMLLIQDRLSQKE